MKTINRFLSSAALAIFSPMPILAAAPESLPQLMLLVPAAASNCSCAATLLTPQKTFHAELINKVNTVQVSIVWNYEDPIDGRCETKAACEGPAVPCKIKFSFTMQVATTLPSGAEILGGAAPLGIVVAGQSASWKDTAEAACLESPTPESGISARIEHKVYLGGSQQPLFTFDPGVNCGKCGEKTNNG